MAITPPYNDVEMKTAWAEDAATTIPSVPVPGIAYRNTALSDETVSQGQQYDNIGRSADWNELLFKISANIVALQKGGASLLWISGRQYEQGALVKDPNNAQIYYRLKAGAGTTRPSSDSTNWQLLQDYIIGEGLKLNSNKITWGTNNTTATDCNTATEAGVYWFNASTKNLPTDIEGTTSNAYGFIIVLKQTNSLIQVAWEISTNTFSFNTRRSANSGSTWSAWTRFGVNFTLDWNSGHDYRVGDLVRDTSNRLLYVCTTAITNSTNRPGLDTGHFTLLQSYLIGDGLTVNSNKITWGLAEGTSSITDIDEVWTEGLYRVSNRTENTPTGAQYGLLIVTRYGINVWQLLQVDSQTNGDFSVFVRSGATNTQKWYNWRIAATFDALDFKSGQTYNQGQLVRGSNNVHYVKKTAASVCNTEPNSDSTNFETLAQNLIDQGLSVIGNKINWGNCNAVTTEDANTAIDPGVYYVNANTKNLPIENRGFIVAVKSSNSARATTMQFFFAASVTVDTQSLYVRTYMPQTSWSDWTKIGPAEETPESDLFVTGDFVFTYRSARDGFLLCNGTAVSRTTYANLFSVIGTKFGAGDGSKTFNLPDFRGKFAQGANGNLGSVIAAGLPNITGSIQIYGVDLSANVGAFLINSESDGYRGGDWNGAANGNVGFNASTANSIYGASKTVQPPAIALNVLIKY